MCYLDLPIYCLIITVNPFVFNQYKHLRPDATFAEKNQFKKVHYFQF